MNEKGRFVHADYIEDELRYSEIYYYLDRYKDKSNFYIHDLSGNPFVELNHTIWILWMQGMEKAPKLIQKCYESVCKNKPDNFQVVLLSADNLDRYVTLPKVIWKKYKNGMITLTHLSDIIRLELLCTYGGCWIDATVFCGGKIPEYMLADTMFLFKMSCMLRSVLKMSSWWIASDRYNRILHAARNILFAYWEDEQDIRNYFLLHIIMSKMIDEDSICNAIYRGIPYFDNGNAHVLSAKLGLPYNDKEWQVTKASSVIQKLSYKRRYLQGDVYNYYTALLEGKLT